MKEHAKAVRPVPKAHAAPRAVKKVRKVPKKKPSNGPLNGGDMSWILEDPHDELFARMLYSASGKHLGESIGLDKDHIIIKNGAKFYSFHKKHVKHKSEDLVLVGNVDWEHARKLGEKWKRDNL